MAGQCQWGEGTNERRRDELTDWKDELVVKVCGYDPQDDGQTQGRSPKGEVMLVGKQTLGHIPIVLESTLLIHPNGDFETAPVMSVFCISRSVSFRSPSLDQKPANAADTPDEDVAREEAHDGSEAQLAEDEKGNAGEEGGQGKRDKGGRDDCLGVIFPNDFGDFTCENVDEGLPGRGTVEGHFSARMAGRGGD